MQVVDTPLPGVKIVQPVVHRDARGFFLETSHHQRYTAAGIPDVFVQDNHSKSVRGTLRGTTGGNWGPGVAGSAAGSGDAASCCDPTGAAAERLGELPVSARRLSVTDCSFVFVLM